MSTAQVQVFQSRPLTYNILGYLSFAEVSSGYARTAKAYSKIDWDHLFTVKTRGRFRSSDFPNALLANGRFLKILYDASSTLTEMELGQWTFERIFISLFTGDGRYPNLKTLTLYKPHMNHDRAFPSLITTQNYEKLTRDCPQLSALCVTDITEKQNMNALLKGLPHLERITFDRCAYSYAEPEGLKYLKAMPLTAVRITEERGLTPVLQEIPALTALQQTSGAGEFDVASRIPTLEEFSVQNDGSNSTALAVLADAPRLRTLRLCNNTSMGNDFCFWEGLGTLARTRISNISIEFCKYLDTALEKLPPFSHLRTISIVRPSLTTMLTNRALEAIASCKGLEQVEIDTRDGPMSLQGGLIDVDGAHHVITAHGMTDEGLAKLGDLPQLSSVKLARLADFTTKGIIDLVHKSPSLKSVEIVRCPYVDPSELRKGVSTKTSITVTGYPPLLVRVAQAYYDKAPGARRMFNLLPEETQQAVYDEYLKRHPEQRGRSGMHIGSFHGRDYFGYDLAPGAACPTWEKVAILLQVSYNGVGRKSS